MSELISNVDIVNRINEHTEKLTTYAEKGVSFTDIDNLLDDYESLHALAKLMYFKSIEKPQLNKDQEIVLGWLKENNPEIVYESPLFTIYQLVHELNAFKLPEKYQTALQNLNEKKITQVIKVFTDWWLSEI